MYVSQDGGNILYFFSLRDSPLVGFVLLIHEVWDRQYIRYSTLKLRKAFYGIDFRVLIDSL